MMYLKQRPGVLYVGMRSVLERSEVRSACSVGQRYLESHRVEAMVLDIRGCKPIDSESIEDLKALLVEARNKGVRRFSRVGEGTLCAVQMEALAQAVDVHTEPESLVDESSLAAVS
jgi:hypothetical protein